MPDSIPYITLRHGEREVSDEALILRYAGGSASLGIPPAAGLAYVDERAGDCDHHGILYTRVTENLDAAGWPVGKPDCTHAHPARQRECMSALRCQVYGGAASRNELGWLFLEKADGGDVEGITTGQPPVCLEHAVAGIVNCRHLIEQGYVLVRAKVPRLYGVLGQVFKAVDHTLEPLPPLTGPNGEDLAIPYTERKLTPWVLASQPLRRLTGVTVVDIDHEVAAAGEAARPPAAVSAGRAPTVGTR